MKFIGPLESKLAIPFSGIVSGNENGPAYRLYSNHEKFFSFGPFNYNYLVPIISGQKRGGKAGHYHHQKKEIFCLLNGQVEVWLENVRTKQRERIRLNGLTPNGFYMLGIPTGISHLIINTGTETANLLVYSNCPPNDEDEIPYEIIK